MFETTTLAEIVGNVGGQLGIWTGASLITVIQAVAYLVSWLHGKIAQLIEQRKTNALVKNVNPYVS